MTQLSLTDRSLNIVTFWKPNWQIRVFKNMSQNIKIEIYRSWCICVFHFHNFDFKLELLQLRVKTTTSKILRKL